MARLKLLDYIDVGSGGPITSVSYEVALDEKFEKIIDSTYENEDAIEEWVTMLPKIDGDGFYSNLKVIYGRIKIHVRNPEFPDKNYDSEWSEFKLENQMEQPVTITKEGNVVDETTSNELGW